MLRAFRAVNEGEDAIAEAPAAVLAPAPLRVAGVKELESFDAGGLEAELEAEAEAEEQRLNARAAGAQNTMPR